MRMMNSIYSQAIIVHIWLGDADGKTRHTLRLLRDIYNYNLGNYKGAKHCRYEGTPHTLLVSNIIEQGQKNDFKSMHRIFYMHRKDFPGYVRHAAGGYNDEQLSRLMTWLFTNPWFRRVWVMQEALGARKALVHCGSEMVP